VLCLSHPASASPRTDAARRLQQAEELRSQQQHTQETAIRAAQAAQAQSTRLADQLVQDAAALRVLEQDMLAGTVKLTLARLAEQQAEAALSARAAAFSALLPLILRLARTPSETVLAVPAPADQALEGLLITRGLATTLNQEAAEFRAQSDQAARLAAAAAQQAQAVATARDAQAKAEARLEAEIAQSNENVSDAERAGRQAAQLVAAASAQAETLRGAIAAMDAAQAKEAAKAEKEARAAESRKQTGAAQAARAKMAAVTRPALSAAPGRMVAPVAGAMLRAFGAPAEDGPATGITFSAAPAAYVASPCTGRIAFAAPFRSYGQLVILECGGDYDFVLAGLGRIDAAPGHSVRAGEPVGRMPGLDAKPGSGHSLYVELRYHGQPVDPAPFLNTRG